MRTAARTLFIALAVLLNYIEISWQLTLTDLFPESRAIIFPPIITLPYKPNLLFDSNLRRINGTTKFDATYTLVTRANYVIGWKLSGNVAQLYTPEGNTNVIFDINNNCFIRLTPGELSALGVGGNLRLIRATDEVLGSDIADPEGYHAGDLQANRQAHFEAKREAALQAVLEYHIQVRRPNETDAARIRAIQRAYSYTYQREFRRSYHTYARENTQNHFYK
ncbi:uncharacterized protein LOC117168938 [Belonocnema kinseyi]|uniref:uncharacterized protein LOC117168938 n=1 Tax=Belonocnema kinseyi TaxID=2817044 RepID=UPI00143D1525|nr:uncharacterized protein LOC117168938 [Belonocnema kinseyi]